MTFSEEIKQYALSIGFDACGICSAIPPNSSREEAGREGRSYIRWIAKKCHADMDYLARNIDKRLDPRLLVESAKSIISVALNYYPQQKLPADVPQFAYYAYGQDYHDVVKAKLKQLFDFIKSQRPNVSGRYFSDSAPVLERFWAARAGIGFIGKNTLLIIPGKGSYFFLGELIINLELDYDKPLTLSCGKCTRCLDACPAKALERAYWLNAGRCISYQTIENRHKIDEEVLSALHNNVYGCDICQKVCPWNKFATPHRTPEFRPSEKFLSLDLEKLHAMNEEDYREIFRKSPVKRAKFAGLKRNIAALKKK